VRDERQKILENHHSIQQSVVIVRDLIKEFVKPKGKSGRKKYTAVDHLNFHVEKRACFGLLGKE
jgi:ABC-type oligopeptide transport system ATPase subunit